MSGRRWPAGGEWTWSIHARGCPIGCVKQAIDLDGMAAPAVPALLLCGIVMVVVRREDGGGERGPLRVSLLMSFAEV